MATLGDLVVNLKMKTAGFSGPAKEARNDLAKLGQEAARMAKSVAVAAAAATTAAAGFGVKLAADAEQAQVAFSVLLGSATEAQRVLSDLSDFAASTPFQLTDLREAGRQLLAFGFSSDELMGRMQLLGDIAAGTGKPISDFVDIFGKVKASGVASLGDVMRLADRGVPIFTALSDQMGVAQSELRSLVSTGKVGFEDLAAALESTTAAGGVFAGGMEQQSRTLSGLFSTLKDNVSFVLQDLGQELIETFNFKGLLNDGIEFIQGFRSLLSSTLPTLIRLGAAISGAAAALVVLRVGAMAYAAAQKLATVQAIFFQAVMNPANLVKIGAALAGAAIFVGVLDNALAGETNQAVQAAEASDKYAASLDKATKSSADLAKESERLAQQGLAGVAAQVLKVDPKAFGDALDRLRELRFIRDAQPDLGNRLAETPLQQIDDLISQAGGLTEAQQKVVDFQRALDALNSMEGDLGGQRVETLRSAITAELGRLSGVTEQIEKAREEISRLQGADPIAASVRDARDKGATLDQANALRDTLQQLAGVRATSRVHEELATVNEQIDQLTLGVTDAEMALGKFRVAGADLAVVKELEAANSQLAELKKQADLSKEADRLTESLRTPMEQFRDEMAKLQEMSVAGLLDEETLARAEKQAKKRSNGGASDRSGPEALRRGTSAAFSAILRSQRGTSESQKQLAEIKMTNKQLTQANQTLKDLVSKAKPGVEVIPVRF